MYIFITVGVLYYSAKRPQSNSWAPASQPSTVPTIFTNIDMRHTVAATTMSPQINIMFE